MSADERLGERGPERRHQEGRREVDRRTHMLEQAVLSAAVLLVDLEPDAPAAERIRARRQLRERVRAYLDLAELGRADVADLALVAVVLAVVAVPAATLGQGWARWMAVMIGLAACAALLHRGERGA